MTPVPCEVLDRIARAAVEAGHRIMAVRAAGYATTAKADSSPLTEADLAAEDVIARRLAEWVPHVHVVSEEATRHPPPPGAPFLLVDPLDGTREFVGDSGEFTVNIALIEDGRPTCVVVVAPALNRIWTGASGLGAMGGVIPGTGGLSLDALRPIRARPRPAARPVAVASRSHLDPDTAAFLDRIEAGERRSIGSSLKFCLLAEGEADVYPRFGPTMEWDTAAGHAVLAAAGGRVETPDGAPFRYGKADAAFRNGPFIAWGAG